MCNTAESVVKFSLDSVQTHFICTKAIFKHPDLTCLCFRGATYVKVVAFQFPAPLTAKNVNNVVPL